MRKFGHTFKKQLGQNFIKSTDTIQKVIHYLDIQPEDNIIEIGPGDGRFTAELLQTEFKKLTLVEIDSELCAFLKTKFETEIKTGKLEILNQSILEFEILNLKFENNNIDKNYKVFGSLPYNISKRIIAQFLETDNKPKRMVFIIQKEVADDYVAKPKRATNLSNYIQIFADVKLVKSIPKSQFYPMPKVDGGVLLIEPKKEIPKESRALAKFIYNGYRNKRKKLSKVLKSIYKDSNWEKTFEALEINPNARAQELEFDKWLELFQVLENEKKHENN